MSPTPNTTTRPETGVDREAKVLQAVVALVDSLVADFDLIEVLTDLTQQCAQLLDVASAGLLLASPGRKLQLMTATSSRTHDLELFQLQAQQGPCLDCFRSGQPVSVHDLHDAVDQWPEFAVAAVDAGFASVHAVPMRSAGTVIGALGLFGTTPGELDDADVTVAQTLAHVATVAILQEHASSENAVLPRLSSALARQVVVEQAKGLVRERLDVSLDRAFELLRVHAHHQGHHLSEVCRTIVSDRNEREEILAGLVELQRDAGELVGPDAPDATDPTA